MFCPQCGSNIINGVKFCRVCGWAVPAAAAVAANQCASCGTVLKDGAKFCPNCGRAVVSPVETTVAPVPAAMSAPAATPAPVPETRENKGPEKSNAINKAVFYHVGKQIYTCYLYKDGIVVGNMTDTHGVFINDAKEWLQAQYENIVIEMI